MLKKLDKIRFRGHKRDEFLDLAESPNASDTECGDEIPVKIPRTSPRDNEELRDPVSTRFKYCYIMSMLGKKTNKQKLIIPCPLYFGFNT